MYFAVGDLHSAALTEGLPATLVGNAGHRVVDREGEEVPKRGARSQMHDQAFPIFCAIWAKMTVLTFEQISEMLSTTVDITHPYSPVATGGLGRLNPSPPNKAPISPI